MDIVVKSVQMSTVKAGVVVARDQHLVPVWEDTEPLEEIKCSCLGSRYREITAVHEDIRLRKVPQEAVYPVGIGQMQYFQFHGAKLINSRDYDVIQQGQFSEKCLECLDRALERNGGTWEEDSYLGN